MHLKPRKPTWLTAENPFKRPRFGAHLMHEGRGDGGMGGRCMISKLINRKGKKKGGKWDRGEMDFSFCSIIPPPSHRCIYIEVWVGVGCQDCIGRFVCVSAALCNLQTALRPCGATKIIIIIPLFCILRRLGTEDNAITPSSPSSLRNDIATS